MADKVQVEFITIKDFDHALRELNIEDYRIRILESNSHGEMMHLTDYVNLATVCRDHNVLHEFRGYFEKVVKHAEENWERPESIFQHMPRSLGTEG